MQIFTVVIDKKEHFERYENDAWDPYDYGMKVLLNRVRGWLALRGTTADVMPESRGKVEDNQLLAAYIDLRAEDAIRAVLPGERLLFKRKDQNIAGLQLADIIAAEQKLLTIKEYKKPMASDIGAFGQRVNEAIVWKVNRFGRYLLV